MRESRVVVIGLDGATFDLIRPWATEGKLPTFARLMDKGTWGNLASTVPPVTSPAWPTFSTGKNPGKHGIFDYIRPRQGRFDLVNASAIDSLVLWEILSGKGKRVGVINVPVTYPPRPVNGFLVAGLLSPSKADFTYPSNFLRRYEAELGPYRVMPNVQYKDGNEDEFIADLQDLIERRKRFALALMQDEPWDFLMIHFLALDVAQHALWHFMDPAHPRHDPTRANRYSDAILQLYQQVDAALAEITALLGDDTMLFLMSDHGFGPLHRVVNLNNLFLETGLLYLKRDPLTRLKFALARLGITPATAYEWLARLGLQSITFKVSKRVRNRVVGRFLSFDDVDWSRTVAYSMGHVGQVYLNMKGRQPQGIVPPEEYERVRQRVLDVLERLVDPHTGRELVDRVIFREEVCHGPHCEQGPDLHLVMDGYRVIAFPLFATNTRVVTEQIRGDSGCHRANGIFVAYGPLAHAGGRIEGANIVDLAPTILHAFGLPVPRDMDGRVLTEIYAPDHLASLPVEFETPGLALAEKAYVLDQEEAQELEDRLRGLGYLG
ncbi:MAG: alkaline phosphatase family protein [Candidatus Hodarchaeales archaeon]|jgi:predicted AlkP superfamily phosphohydrolase/phosphomutase